MTDILHALRAVLGEPGDRDAHGFSNVTSAVSTSRPITITDAAGKIVYTKQTEDTEKAADNHIRNAGFRRVGPWVDGVATVELVPLGAKLKKPLIALAVLALAIAGVSNFVARFAHK
ncbi:hypothetical protein [Arthrobacter sp. ok362]|uniref:hypothetical protein n=1 Tax=Arthrobacter sp. ok362 TaxID=1761745 RepID=UPI00088A9DD5|nr:hypothetical protein [Arthrobacter sp. ok362]SDL41314.1 hypothetical protein SAMN04487913_109103 [Arthrobacter sp. ok362]